MPYADPAKRRKYYQEYQDRMRSDRKAKGLCISCGADALGKSQCPSCLKLNAVRVQRNYQKLRKGGKE